MKISTYTYHTISRVIVAASFLVAIIVYPKLPARSASHWNIDGEVDGYTSSLVAVSIMPVLSAVMLLLFTVLPAIDPKRKNAEGLSDQLAQYKAIILLFLFYLYILTLAWNLGQRFNMMQFLAPAFGMLFYYVGILLESVKPNWFAGIRTPWTLSSDEVWEKTHKVGASLFKGWGVSMIVAMIMPELFFVIMMAGVVISLVFSYVYSYMEYKKIVKK